MPQRAVFTVAAGLVLLVGLALWWAVPVERVASNIRLETGPADALAAKLGQNGQFIYVKIAARPVDGIVHTH